MIATLAIAAQLVVAPLPPQDWSTLQPLPYAREIDGEPALSAFVRDEVKAGRCAAATSAPTGWVLRVDVAVLIGADGQPRRTVPRAIACPSVEQYAAGLVSSLARGKAVPDAPPPEAWYRATITFSWPA